MARPAITMEAVPRREGTSAEKRQEPGVLEDMVAAGLSSSPT